MIVVKVEMWPGGDKSRKRSLGSMSIANVSGNDKLANYIYELYGAKGITMNSGNIMHYPRKRLHVFNLLYRILVDAGRNK